ncbi:MAG: hypothetical protein JWO02_2786, partial [Solirubrobacterales bacterium]|nr:hypothetical protein [Solirubrobacterales bacterium]
MASRVTPPAGGTPLAPAAAPGGRLWSGRAGRDAVATAAAL